MKLHVGLSIRGALRNGVWRQELAGAVRVDGKLLTPNEIFDMLCDHLALGHEMLPYGECDNWSWIEGCLGHPDEPSSG